MGKLQYMAYIHYSLFEAKRNDKNNKGRSKGLSEDLLSSFGFHCGGGWNLGKGNQWVSISDLFEVQALITYPNPGGGGPGGKGIPGGIPGGRKPGGGAPGIPGGGP